MIDQRDRKLLTILQENADVPIGDLAERVALSVSACWRRIKRLEEDGYIRGRTAFLDRDKINLSTTVFVLLRTSDHSMDWLERFRRATADIPEIVETYRLAGNIDYLMKIVLPDVAHWDVIYKRLVNKVNFLDVSSYITMEEMKFSRQMPTNYIPD